MILSTDQDDKYKNLRDNLISNKIYPMYFFGVGILVYRNFSVVMDFYNTMFLKSDYGMLLMFHLSCYRNKKYSFIRISLK